MTTALVVLAITVIVIAAIGLAVYMGRKYGGAEQAAADTKAAKKAEDKIHQVQAEERDTSETEKRLDKGTF